MSSYNPNYELSAEVDNLIKSFQTLEMKESLESLPDEVVQYLFGSVLKLYVSRLNENPSMHPFADGTVVNATEAAVAATRILKQVNVEVFELAMWQTMGSVR